MGVQKKRGQLDALDAATVRNYLTTDPAITTAGDASRPYEEAVVGLVGNNEWTKEEIESVLKPLIEEVGTEPDLAYAAYYALCSFYRRNTYTNEYSALIQSPKNGFKERESYPFLALMCEKLLNPKDWRLLSVAQSLCMAKGLCENHGVKHCFAEYVAAACESDPARMNYLNGEFVKSALEMLEDAIIKSQGYPKYFITRARLRNVQAICHEKEELMLQSQGDIELGIEKEQDLKKKDQYRITGIRLKSEYYAMTLEKKMVQQETALQKQFEQNEDAMQKQFQENNVKNLEFLSFFSAVIGLLIAGTQTVLNMAFPQAAAVLIVLAGCLLTAFGALGYILHGNDEAHGKVNKKIVIIGITLLVIAIVVGTIYALYVQAPPVQQS